MRSRHNLYCLALRDQFRADLDQIVRDCGIAYCGSCTGAIWDGTAVRSCQPTIIRNPMIKAITKKPNFGEGVGKDGLHLLQKSMDRENVSPMWILPKVRQIMLRRIALLEQNGIVRTLTSNKQCPVILPLWTYIRIRSCLKNAA